MDRCAVLLGLPIDDVTIDEAVDRIAEMVESGRASGRVHQIATVNVDFVVNAVNDPTTLEILQRTDLAIPDGMPVVWGARLLGSRLHERATGVDLLPTLVERAAASGHRICLFGGTPGVAEAAATLLRQRHPGAQITGLEAPAVGRDGTMDPSALEPICAARPDIVGVALGNPKQERWIARHGPALGAPVLIGIGGTLDFLTGVTRRAPPWMQRSGLEWLHRAMSEPRRLAGRYAKDLVVFAPGLLAQAWRGRRRSASVVPVVSVDANEAVTVQLMGSAAPERIEPLVTKALASGTLVTIDLRGLGHLDNATLATIVGLRRLGRLCGTDVVVRGASPTVRTAARRLGVEGLIGGAA